MDDFLPWYEIIHEITIRKQDAFQQNVILSYEYKSKANLNTCVASEQQTHTSSLYT